MFEAWLSFSAASTEGLVAAGGAQRRYTIACLIVPGEEVADAAALERAWLDCSTEHAKARLAGEDVKVTNGRDKTTHLAKIFAFDDTVRSARRGDLETGLVPSLAAPTAEATPGSGSGSAASAHSTVMSGHQQSSAGSRSISAGPHTGSAHRTSRHQLPSGAAQAKLDAVSPRPLRSHLSSPSSFPERDMSPRTRANAARMAVEGERRQGADNARKLQEARRQQLVAQRTTEHEERVRHAAAGVACR